MRSTTRTLIQSTSKSPHEQSGSLLKHSVSGCRRAYVVDEDKYEEQNTQSGNEGLLHEASTLGTVVSFMEIDCYGGAKILRFD